MQSSERWKEALEGDGVPRTRRRELGELRWRAAVLCARSEGEIAGERVRERAPGGGENGEGGGVVHSGGGRSWRRRAAHAVHAAPSA